MNFSKVEAWNCSCGFAPSHAYPCPITFIHRIGSLTHLGKTYIALILLVTATEVSAFQKKKCSQMSSRYDSTQV